MNDMFGRLTCLALFFSVTTLASGGEPVQLPDTSEKAAVEALIDRFNSVEKVSLGKDGELRSIHLLGLPNLEKASFRLVFDPESQRVIEAGGNRAAFRNDEWAMFAPLQELQVLNLHHNFGAERENRKETYDAGGLVALQGNEKLESIQLPGSPFGADGLKAVAGMPQVEHLGIWHVNVSDEDLEVLRGHPNFESIRIAPMWSDKLTDKTFEHLSYCPNLKKIAYNEGYVTWENGLKHLERVRDSFEELDLEKSVVAPEDLEKFKKEFPNVVVKHAGMATVGAMIRDNFKGAAKKLPQWVPQDLIDQYVAAAE